MATVFLSWSALYFGIKYYQAIEVERRRALIAENSARESELRALRYQIHPHFLFNTLNAISILVVEGQAEAAMSMISRLADFFPATLEAPAVNEVSLDDELFLAKQYLEIERLRLGERLRVEITVDPALLSCLVPHLFLQPLLIVRDYGMSVSKTGPEIIGFQIRVVREDRLRSFPLSKQTENEFDGDAHTTNDGFTTKNLGVHCYASKNCLVDHGYWLFLL